MGDFDSAARPTYPPGVTNMEVDKTRHVLFVASETFLRSRLPRCRSGVPILASADGSEETGRPTF
jgi:hypothetical protein